MMKKKYILFTLFLSVLSSCMTLKEASIEILVPGEVVYPVQAQRVVLVDNSTDQTPELGHEIYLNKLYSRHPYDKLIGTDTVKLDSLGFACIYNAVNTLNKSDFFSEIIVHPVKLHSELGYNVDSKLSATQVKSILDSYNADVILSLDRMMYESRYMIRAYATNYYDNVTMDVNYDLSWRIYYPERHKKPQEIKVVDTLYWPATQEGRYLKAIPREDAVSEAIWRAGEKSGQKLAPHWEKVNRLYYVKGNYQFKLANKYYDEGKWKEAYDLWEFVYLSYSNSMKARAAFNLAYLSEVSGNLPNAKLWIDKALVEFNRSVYVYNGEYDMVMSYKKILEDRIKEDELLKKQYETAE